MSDTKVFGEILPKKTLLFRVGSGSAKNKDTGIEYELSTNVGDRAPIIRSDKTGEWFTLSWTDIIGMAVEAGIDKR